MAGAGLGTSVGSELVVAGEGIHGRLSKNQRPGTFRRRAFARISLCVH